MSEEVLVDEFGGLLTQSEAAAFLGVAERTLEHWRFQKRGPGYLKVGDAVRYPATWLKDYLLKNKVCHSAGACGAKEDDDAETD